MTRPGCRKNFMKNFIRHLLLGLCIAFSTAALGTSSTFAAAGDLYSGGLGIYVYKFTPAGVQTVFALVPVADAVAFDQKGNLYVSDLLDNTVIQITPGGTQTTYSAGVEAAGLAVDPVGNLYAAFPFGNVVTKFPADNSIPIDYPLAATPFGLALDRAGNLFVSLSNNTVIKIAPSGTQSTFVPLSAGLQAPAGLAVDSNGNLYR